MWQLSEEGGLLWLPCFWVLVSWVVAFGAPNWRGTTVMEDIFEALFPILKWLLIVCWLCRSMHPFHCEEEQLEATAHTAQRWEKPAGRL